MNKVALITGLTSQDGSYLSQHLLNLGYKVVGVVRSTQNLNLSNLKYLKIDQEIVIEVCDLTDGIGLMKLYQKYLPDEIYNLAAQSSVGISFEHPFSTIHFNSISVLNILEIIRISKHKARFLQPCSSEMYGGNINLPINENSIIFPSSPYAISKATNFWTVQNYRNAYGIKAFNAILFNHESFLRSENFFIKKVIKKAVLIKKKKAFNLKVGNLNIRRDFGYAPEYVKALHLILNSETSADYVISSGHSYSLKEIVEYVFSYLDLPLDCIIVDEKLFRPVEISDMYGNPEKIKRELGWKYDYNFFAVLNLLIEEELNFFNSND